MAFAGHSPYARHHAKHFAYIPLISHSNYEVGTMITPILQRRKLND